MTLENHAQPIVPSRFILIQSLRSRMSLPPELEKEYDRLHRGHIGEQKFSQSITPLLPDSFLSLYSLDLKHRDASFQIDNLLFCAGQIYLFEIKYFAGDYIIHHGNWFTLESQIEINNPFTQLRRASSFLRQTVQELGWRGEVIESLVFMHDAFTLFGASPDDPIIFLSQFQRKMKRIITNGRPAGPGEIRLAKQLAARHQTTNQYEQAIPYQYENLWKGLICPQCYARLERVSKRSVKCLPCNRAIPMLDSLLFNIQQYHFLFPDRSITVSNIFDWTGGEVHRRTIRRILLEHGMIDKSGRNTEFLLE